MKKPRTKKYRPRPVSKTGGLSVFESIKERTKNSVPLAAENASNLGACHWLNLDRMVTGDGSEEAWTLVSGALNIATVLCEAGIGAEHEEAFDVAREGAQRSYLRGKKTGSFRFDGEAMRDIRKALVLYDAQLEVATRGEFIAALQAVRQRIDAGIIYEVAA